MRLAGILAIAIPLFFSARPADAQRRAAVTEGCLLVADRSLRDPLVGRAVPMSYWFSAFAIAFGGLCFALPFIGRYRRRLIYWL